MMYERHRIGDYEVENEIARGGFGIVFRAKHVHTGGLVAIKILQGERVGESSTLLRFEREATIVFELAHPNLTRVHSWGRLEDGRPFIVMELLEGESLDKRIRRTQRVPPEETLEIVESIAAALDVAHARGIIHRDIKPANIFLAPNRSAGKVVLLDFGIAKLVGTDGPVLTTSRASLGTIPYMSPEQIRGESVDVRSDVYSFAALTYTMLTGSPPFGTQPTAVLRQIHLHTRPPRPSERAPVIPFLDEPILEALSPSPNQRPRSAIEFVTSLETQFRLHSPQSPSSCKNERRSLGVFAEIRKSGQGQADDDEMLAEALETGLRIVAMHLSKMGLVIVQETSKRLLAVSPEPPDEVLLREVQKVCIDAYRHVVALKMVDLAISIHCATVKTNEAGTMLPTALLDISSWVPAHASGVVASQPALMNNFGNLAAVSGAPGFFWIER